MRIRRISRPIPGTGSVSESWRKTEEKNGFLPERHACIAAKQRVFGFAHPMLAGTMAGDTLPSIRKGVLPVAVA
jgi:hypothetical protein